MAEERNCIEQDCTNVFILSDEELKYYSSKIRDKKPGSPTFGQEIQMIPPRRCLSCRAKKKAMRAHFPA